MGLNSWTPDFGGAIERVPCLLQGLGEERTGRQQPGLFHQHPTAALTCITPEAVLVLPTIHLNLVASNWS